MPKNIVATILIISIALLSGCLGKEKDIETKSPSTSMEINNDSTSIPTPTSDNKYNWMENLSNDYNSEWLKGKGIDIASIVNQNVEDTSIITFMRYNITYCNLSKTDINYNDDIVLRIDINRNVGGAHDINLICVFINNGGEILKNVLTEKHMWLDFRAVDITGDGKEEIVLKTDEGGNKPTEMPINILSYNSKSGKMDCIFDEMLEGAIFPLKFSNDSDFQTMKFHNEYKFVKSQNKGYDIVMNCNIIEKPNPSKDEDAPCQTGSMRFRFNGIRYTVDGKYYDYKAIAKKLYDEKSKK